MILCAGKERSHENFDKRQICFAHADWAGCASGAGLYVPQGNLGASEYLKKISSTKEIYVLTDPDYPGDRIRKILDENIEGLNHCFINKENSIKHGKVGVAESTIQEIENALKNAIKTKDHKNGTITMNDLVKLGLSGLEKANIKRNEISKKLNLGHCNAKTFLKRINYCNIEIEELKKHLWM